MVVTQIIPAPVQISSQFAFKQSLYLAHAMKNFVENVTGHAHCKSVDMEAVTDKCNTSHE